MHLADGPVHLVGHSFGATATLLAALDLGDQVQSLTLIEPVQFAAARGTDAFNDHGMIFQKIDQAIQDGDRRFAAHRFLDLWGEPNAWRDLPASGQAALAAMIHVIPAQTGALRDDVNGILTPGRLEGFQVPVRLIEGSKSHPVVAAVHDHLEQRLPNVERHIINGAGHMCPITHAPDVANIIRPLLVP